MAIRQLDATPYNSHLGTFDAAQKVFYSNLLGTAIINEFPEYAWLKKEGRISSQTPPGGKYIEFLFESLPSSGAGWRGEGDRLPIAGRVTNTTGKVAWRKFIKGRTTLTWEALKWGTKGLGNMIDARKQEFDRIMTAMRHRAIPAFWGNGDGVLGYINGAVSSSTSVTMLQSETYNKLAPGTRWIFPGVQVISCNTPANSYGLDSSMTGAVIVNRRTSNTALTMASAISATDAYVLVEHECADTSNTAERTYGSVSLGTASSCRWPTGFNAMCDNGTFVSSYEGISESTYDWSANVLHNSGTLRPPTTALGREMYYKIGQRHGKPPTGLVGWMNYDLHQEYIKQLEPFVEYAPRNFKPGDNSYDWVFGGTEIPLKMSYNVPMYIYFLHPESINFIEHTPPGIGGQDDQYGDMYERVTDYDQFQSVFRWGFQLWTHDRKNFGVIRDIQATVKTL